MPKAAQYVEYNDYGTWVYALVEAETEAGPGNFDLLYKSKDGGCEHAANVPEGTASGHWREP